MRFLEVADVLAIAAEATSATVDEVLDGVALLPIEAVLSAARREQGSDPTAAAAVLLHGLLTRRPFRDGNEVIALLAALQFLALNGFELCLFSDEDAGRLIVGAASGHTQLQDLRAWMSKHLSRSGSGGRGERMFARGRRRSGQHMPLERFTAEGRQVIKAAKEEARAMEHGAVGSEHLLLGLLARPEGVPARALEALGVSLEGARSDVRRIERRRARQTAREDLAFTPEAAKALGIAAKEAFDFGQTDVGPEHILLALTYFPVVCSPPGKKSRIGASLGLRQDQIRREVWRLVAPPRRETTGAPAVGRAQVMEEIEGLFDENDRLRAEVERLHALLEEHGIEPDGGASRSA